MQNDEQEIIDYLKGSPGAFVSGKEIARRAAGKERFVKEPGWAVPILAQLVQHGILETDHLGCFRFKPVERKKERLELHVAPQLLKILKSSGRTFEGVSFEEETPSKSAVPTFPDRLRAPQPPAAPDSKTGKPS